MNDAQIMQRMRPPGDDTDVPEASRPITGERRLAMEVFKHAVFECHLHGGVGEYGELLRLELRRWILSDDETWPFSFVPLCETLGYAPSEWRTKLLAVLMVGGPKPKLYLEESGGEEE